jgi:transcriptional regulator with XRE-family HTH domain
MCIQHILSIFNKNIYMKLYEKVKLFREDKKLPQEYIAHELGLSQSQYSRRESGSIKFIPEELRKLSKILEIPIAQLFDEESNSFSVQTQNGGNFAQYITLPEKLIDQYEQRIKEKDDIISFLKEKFNQFKNK